MNSDTSIAKVETPVFDISDFVTDPVKESEGVWHPLGKGREIKLARGNNEVTQSSMRSRYKANRAILDQDDEVAFKLNEDIMVDVYAQTVIKGLRVNGAEIPYTPAKGVELMQHRDFRDKIFLLAKGMDAYKTAADDTAVKS